MNGSIVPQTQCTKQDQLEILSTAGFAFNLLATGGKNAIEVNWPHRPRSADQARRHSGNLGVLAGRKSGGIIWIDIDIDFVRFLATFPQLANGIISYRDDAPDRGKVAIRITDHLPASTNWRPDGPKPHAELLSTGRYAAVVGMHPDGEPYRLKGSQVVSMTFAEVSAIWRKWTGKPLPDPTATNATEYTQNAAERRQASPWVEDDPNSLRARVKTHWTAYAVFEHFGRANEVKKMSGDNIKLRSNGGLIVGDPAGPEPWRWFCFSDGIGGDQVDAWAYCTTGTVSNSGNFHAMLIEMATAAGIAPEPQIVTFTNTDTGERTDMSVSEACTVLQERFADLEAYPLQRDILGRPMTYRRRIDRAVMMAMIERMRIAGRVEAVKYDARSMAEAGNINKNTAAKALRRLVQYGFLERTIGESWFDDDLLEHDQHVANRFDAMAYTLGDEVCRIKTGCSSVLFRAGSDGAHGGCTLAGETKVDTVSIHHTFADYADHDAFAWGAKDAGDDEAPTLGKSALDVLVTLEDCNDLTYADIAEATGMGRSAVSKKARALAHYGLVEVYRDGRTCYVYLRDNWRDILESVWLRLTTFARGLKRRVDHLRERIRRVEDVVNVVDSGKLSLALSEMLTAWQRKLSAINRQIAELNTLRDPDRTNGLHSQMATAARIADVQPFYDVRTLGAAVAEFNNA